MLFKVTSTAFENLRLLTVSLLLFPFITKFKYLLSISSSIVRLSSKSMLWLWFDWMLFRFDMTLCSLSLVSTLWLWVTAESVLPVSMSTSWILSGLVSITLSDVSSAALTHVTEIMSNNINKMYFFIEFSPPLLLIEKNMNKCL